MDDTTVQGEEKLKWSGSYLESSKKLSTSCCCLNRKVLRGPDLVMLITLATKNEKREVACPSHMNHYQGQGNKVTGQAYGYKPFAIVLDRQGKSLRNLVSNITLLFSVTK